MVGGKGENAVGVVVRTALNINLAMGALSALEQLGKLNQQLNVVRVAAKALGGSADREVVGVKKRVLSAAGKRRL
jgi:hypothetical protein